MLVKEILKSPEPSVSFEFFPPKKEKGWEKLFQTINALAPLDPAYASVTYGAGGSTRENTHVLVERLKNETQIPVVAHLTCVKSRREEIKSILDRYNKIGVNNILALRGDLPQQHLTTTGEDFPHAIDLVKQIKNYYPDMGVGVSGFPEGHPATPNRLLEIEYLKAKVDAGADYIVTQFFFDNRDYYDFCERCQLAGIEVPIVPGLMPLLSLKQMYRMAELAGGARFPAALQRQIAQAKTPSEVSRIGINWATEQAHDLLQNEVAGIHFYTLNSSDSTIKICRTIGIPHR